MNKKIEKYNGYLFEMFYVIGAFYGIRDKLSSYTKSNYSEKDREILNYNRKEFRKYKKNIKLFNDRLISLNKEKYEAMPLKEIFLDIYYEEFNKYDSNTTILEENISYIILIGFLNGYYNINKNKNINFAKNKIVNINYNLNSFYKEIKNITSVTIEAFEHYQKRSTRNRYTIISANGPTTLSIPLQKGKNNQTPIQDVLISYETNWIASHLNSIKSAYGKSAYFEHYFPYIEQLYLKNYKTLFNLNNASNKLVFKLLRIDIDFKLTSEYLGNPQEIDVTYKYLPYPQVFEYKHGFIQNCCILDLLFCMGPESILYL